MLPEDPPDPVVPPTAAVPVPAAPAAPVRVDLPPAGSGRRVVVRHRLPDGSATDLLGMLEDDGSAADDGAPGAEGVVLVRRDDGGLVQVRRADVLAARPVPPRTRRPTGRGRADGGAPGGRGGPPVVGVLDLEAVLALAWRPVDLARSGRWLLRSAEDRTRRASSVLVLGSPDGDLAGAVEGAAAWARRHGSTPRFQLPCPTGTPVGAAARADAAGLAVAADLDQLLAARGWPVVSPTTVMVGWTTDLRGGGPGPARPGTGPQTRAGTSPGAPRVAVDDAPSTGWRAVVRPGAARDPVVDALLVSAPQQAFATAVPPGAGGPAAAGRVALCDGWAVVTDLAVEPAARRRGLARAVLAALAGWALGRGADRVALQVADGNDAARALYDSLGLVEHHRYAYREHP
ncbi:GNAT family N-acetyltransferase [Pseudokineococcus basanitobsidens]|uniref:GNAT family N-acetyltransferase n=1 Tax=Pseudokineococcus basanitobsidens TaxID=1926649 RepID=A0ABU8RIN9_9ACTN